LSDPNTPRGKLTPVTLKVKFKSETPEQFIERYAVDVSSGGIFLRTKEPLSVGTQMKFELQLRDASPLIAGEGTVVWTRENDPSRPAIAPGMGVRFDRLADGSQGILERILTEKMKQPPAPGPRFREADNDDNPFAIGTRGGFFPEQALEREPKGHDKDVIWLIDAGVPPDLEQEGDDDDVIWLAVADAWSRSRDELIALKSDLTDLNFTLESRTGE
jgi:uncharacterized protein (TIGR02266 family)